MANESLLLNFVVPTTIQDVLPSADLSWLKHVMVIVKPKENVENGITDCVKKSEITDITDSKCFELLDSGLNLITLVAADTLENAKTLLDNDTEHRYLTILVDPAFEDITNALAWTREYVMGWSTNDKTKAKSAASGKDVCCFFDEADVNGILMYRAFGQFLSGNTWKDCQLARLDDSDQFGVKDLGVANELFDAGVSFAITDPEYKTSLALFAAGKFTITAPYILKQAKIQSQGLFIQYLNLRNPKYTVREAGLIENYLNTNMQEIFVTSGLTEELNISVDLDSSLNDWYVIGTMEMKRPRAIWRMKLTFFQDIIA